MSQRKTILSVLLLAAIFLAPEFSKAEISFQPLPAAGINDVLNNLPGPINDFVKNAKDINTTVNSYIGTTPIKSPVSLDQINLTQWLQGALQNSLITSIYSTFIKIIYFIGNLAIWALGFVIDLIKQGLALIH